MSRKEKQVQRPPEGTPVWERWPGEPYKWFHRFYNYYRPIGPERTVTECWKRWREAEADENYSCKRPTRHWWARANTWHWEERARAWDELNREKMAQAEREAREEMLQRHKELARAMVVAASRRMRDILDSPTMLTPAETRKYITDGIAEERRAWGLPEYLLRVTELEDDELLKQYEHLVAALEADSGAGSGDGTAGDGTPPPGEE